ncbi:3'-5' exonuclease [Cupriavidus taiwanensis]|uniref:3'-5' exonuclease n=1 Tax=Cupriavidus taiwanensis TaxID=164546 RepID=UPI00253FE1F2|nr:3'-5' exonuclease [Cupriavidus taiwanensis]MDK3022828.1 3'-5' exonuclease [Cupriavidus taiwanensis]
MRALLNVAPTPEQLALFSRIKPGVEVIRGAAGSGKTTTALLKLRSLLTSFVNRKIRQKREDPIRILLLTYNRTLTGYIQELASSQFAQTGDIELQVSTFSYWAFHAIGNPTIVENDTRRRWLRELGAGLDLSMDFIEEEVDYLLGRFLPADLDDYLTARREGRGGTPRMSPAARAALMEAVVRPYLKRKADNRVLDWNDVAVAMASEKYFAYDIVIVDETQDFSANQIRAIMNQLMDVHAAIFVLDTVQRIYARGFTWQEVGLTVRPENSFRLSNNYRNTKQIAQFAASVIDDLATDDDGTTPNFASAMRDGPMPVVLRGCYGDQLAHAIKKIKNEIDLDRESVAFLHTGWCDFLKDRLAAAGLEYIEITRQSEWPQGPENIAVSTLHSAKGLEFDHVFILGLTAKAMPHGEGTEDEKLIALRRLVAMGIGRARCSVTVGYKPGEESQVVSSFGAGTFEEIAV